MHWSPDDCQKVIFSDESAFHELKRKNQCKIWHLEKEKLLPECIQQTNTGDGGEDSICGGISGFGTMATKIYTEKMGGRLYCDVLQRQVKPFMAQMPKIINSFFHQDLSPWRA